MIWLIYTHKLAHSHKNMIGWLYAQNFGSKLCLQVGLRSHKMIGWLCAHNIEVTLSVREFRMVSFPRPAKHECNVCSAKLQFIFMVSIMYFGRLLRRIKGPKVYMSVVLPGELDSAAFSINLQ